MFVSEILKTKGSDVVGIGPDETVTAAACLLKGRGIRVVLVRDAEGTVVGVISERDMVRGIAMYGERVLEMPVRDLMTTEVITCKPTDIVSEAMKVLTRHGFHHLPVMNGDTLMGIISIGDCVKQHIDDLTRQIRSSKETEFDERH